MAQEDGVSAPHILMDKAEVIPIDSVKLYPKNPRRGSVDAIMESMSENGQYMPIVVQESTGYVIVGNHRLRAAKKLGWDSILAITIDVDDERAKKILLADNRTTDIATYDAEVLRELMVDMPDVIGTGYTEQERNLIAAVTSMSDPLFSQVEEVIKPLEVYFGSKPEDDDEDDSLVQAMKKAEKADKGAAGLTNPKPEQDDVIRTLDDVSSDLEGILDLKATVVFPIRNYWGIPQLAKNMMVDVLPDPIDTWAGREATPDDGVSHYLYNYGVDSAKGLPWDRTILSFFTHDFHFENWWRTPAHYVAKVMNAGVKMAVTPDWSTYTDDPRVVHLWNWYRSMWIGRYMQEAGIKIIPSISWADEESLNYLLEGIPQGSPTVALQVQNIRAKNVDQIETTKSIITKALSTIQPDNVIVYGGGTGQNTVRELGLPHNFVYLDNRAAKRRGKVYDVKQGYEGVTKDEDDEEPGEEYTSVHQMKGAGGGAHDWSKMK